MIISNVYNTHGRVVFNIQSRTAAQVIVYSIQHGRECCK